MDSHTRECMADAKLTHSATVLLQVLARRSGKMKKVYLAICKKGAQKKG